MSELDPERPAPDAEPDESPEEMPFGPDQDDKSALEIFGPDTAEDDDAGGDAG
ncbi:MAG TPA: hypothetical protein VLN26_06090 [Gaiellaceae bacterium]|nr:hypothetical protein [Gaiellaceae bacterium]